MAGMLARVCFVVALVALGPAAWAQGWVVFADGGSVYRVEVGGQVESLYAGNADHACWSADGLRVFFIKTNGEIWSMYNDGTSARKIANGTTTNYGPIGPYRPDPDYVLYVEDDSFYRVHCDTGTMTRIHQEPRSYVGETAIDTAGTRMAGRGSNSNLYKITLGGGSESYSSDCSSSISPGGAHVTANVSGHTELRIHAWSGGVVQTLHAPSGKEWDNQKFAANSNDWIVYKYDNEAAIGIIRVADDHNVRVCSRGADYPDFFAGSLPDVPQDNQPPTAAIDAPRDGAAYEPGEVLSYAGHATDPEDGNLAGAALAWEVDRVGDGQGPVHTATGASGSHTFPADIGEDTSYLVRLTATDSGGRSDSVQITVWVRPQAGNAPPTIHAIDVSPNPADVGTAVTLACTASDPDTDPLTYHWSFGDGQTGSGASVGHSYTEAGSYTARVDVDDGQGHSVSAQEAVHVIDPDMIVIECEDMQLDGYEIEGDWVATFDTGTATLPFPGPDGTYRTRVVIIKEDDGQPTLDVYLAGGLAGTIHYPLGASGRDPETVDLGVFAIGNGDEVKIVGTLDAGAAARADKLIFEADTIVEEDGGADAGQDAGPLDGADAGADAGGGDRTDAGSDPGPLDDADAGADAGADAPDDGGTADGAGDTTSSEDESVAGSCGCGAAPHAALPLWLLVVLAVRRRRSSPGS